MCALWLLVLLCHACAYVQIQCNINWANKGLYIKLFSITLFCLMCHKQNCCKHLITKCECVHCGFLFYCVMLVPMY